MTEGVPRPRVATVTVEPSGLHFDVRCDETIFAAALRQGYRWPTVCGGLGTCRTCVLTVVEGAANVSEIGPWEAEGLAEANIMTPAGCAPRRLACQVLVSGDVTVRKPGVRTRPAPD